MQLFIAIYRLVATPATTCPDCQLNVAPIAPYR